MDKIILKDENGAQYEVNVSALRKVEERVPVFNCGTVGFLPGECRDRHGPDSYPVFTFNEDHMHSYEDLDETKVGFGDGYKPGIHTVILTRGEVEDLRDKMTEYLNR